NFQIEYTLNVSGSVSLEIYNILGQKAYTIVDEKQERGKHSYLIDGTNTGLSKGVYFLKMQSGGRLNTKKIVKL
ncbi:T9SS type A sorting domain-containing protein, partial [bacterium AH-315-M05]|nr:T9SS type A sorting domain-containing protein [bacterium AH-315-M05]